jgi:Ca2+-binding RTX toxin-like protein
VLTTVDYTLGANVENLTLLGTSNLNGTGNALNNSLLGNAGDKGLYGLDGNDTLSSDGGNDTLDGGTGADKMAGGTGNDAYYVDNVGDVVVENAAAGSDRVLATVDYTLSANVEKLTLLGSANLNGTGNILDNNLTGNSGNNMLLGLDGNDTISGNGGNDTLDGGTGADKMAGGTGNDAYYVDNVGDVIVEDAGSDIDRVRTTVSYTLGNYVENLTLLGAANLNGTGNELANSISGNSGDNVLTGGAGDDTIDGGIGADTFVFAAAGATNGYDTILDFVHGTDKLVFSGADYGFAPGHTLTASEFTAGSAASGASPQFIWDASTHTLYWDDDGTGSDAAIAIAGFNGTPTVTASDFVFT